VGLDAVELVMAVEEKFGINITDQEATKARTVGDLKRLVRAKLDISDASECLTQRAFHLIRRTVITELGVPRRSLRPDTLLEGLVPPSTRRESWQKLQAALGVAELPELVRPHSVNLMITVLVLSTIVVPVWYGALHSEYFGRWILLGAIASSVLGWGLARLTGSMRTKFKTGHDRVSDLARFLVARYPQLIGKPRGGKWTGEEISCLLNQVIIEQLGVTGFDDSSRFVEDLRID
jgi:hypothetical protein